MGDAGPLNTPALILESELSTVDARPDTSVREVTVLVTGFGPFKSFSVNPSWLIASSLPSVLLPQNHASKSSSSDGSEPENTTRQASQEIHSRPYTIRLLLHPSPVRVAYATAATVIPQLLQTHNPDYVLHIGMAGGRDHYTLETRAHRDNYKIKDIDERDGWKEGEHVWKGLNVPEVLPVEWDEADVLKRWKQEVYDAEETLGLTDGVKGRGGKSTVALSSDAGRFLCEYSLMCSLARRWVEAREEEKTRPSNDRDDDKDHDNRTAQGSAGSMEGTTDHGKNPAGKEGKVAFFHVPGNYAAEDIVRGVRIAEALIRSLVGSWEEGRRRQQTDSVEVERGRWEGVVWKA